MNMGTRKETDAFLRIRSRNHPVMVVEPGWADEPERDLLEDVRDLSELNHSG